MGNGSQSRPRTAESSIKQKSQADILAERSENARQERQKEQAEFSKLRSRTLNNSQKRKTAFSFGEMFDEDVTPIRAGAPKIDSSQGGGGGSMNTSRVVPKQKSNEASINRSQGKVNVSGSSANEKKISPYEICNKIFIHFWSPIEG
jgi:hypothetical protein